MRRRRCGRSDNRRRCWCGRSDNRCWCRCRCRYRRSDSRRSSGHSDDREHGSDGNHGVLSGADLEQSSGSGRRNLGVYLVRGDFDQWFICRDLIAHLLQPPRDGAFGDALAKLGEYDFGTRAWGGGRNNGGGRCSYGSSNNGFYDNWFWNDGCWRRYRFGLRSRTLIGRSDDGKFSTDENNVILHCSNFEQDAIEHITRFV